jgi:alpha/beta superfamily hydrolase
VNNRVRVPSSRSVPATLDEPTGSTDSCVVACPPHPQLGGSRSNNKLTAVAEALVERDVACLRFDYGEWDDGRGEQHDASDALEWARKHYARVGLFGFSFGGGVALLVAADRDDLVAVSALAPAARLSAEFDAVAALDRIEAPLQVIYGERDDTADWEPVVARARELDASVEAIPGDHHFVGQTDDVGRLAGTFFDASLGT